MKIIKISIATALLILGGLAVPDWLRERSTLLAMIEEGGSLEVVFGASRHMVDTRLFGVAMLLVPVVLLAGACVLLGSAFKERKEPNQSSQPAPGRG